MARVAYPSKDNHLKTPVIFATVEECEKAWSHGRDNWGGEDMDDTDDVIITLGATKCGVWLSNDSVLGERDPSLILVDEPADSGVEMARAFGLELDFDGDECDDSVIGYKPNLLYA